MSIFSRLFGAKSSTQSNTPQPVSEQYLFSLVDHIQERERTAGYGALTPAEQVFYCVWTVEAEVNNGGFDQFYFNSSGDIAVHAPAALRAIGAGHTASIVEQANTVFGPDGPPVDRNARQEALGSLDESTRERFEVFDAEFLEYKDDLSALLAAHMRANA